MQKHDPLSFGTDSRLLIDELHASRPAPLDHRVEVVDRKADVVDSRSSLCYEARDRRRRVVGLQQLHQRLACAEAHYARAVSVIERNFGQPQYIPEKRKARGDSRHGDSNVGYARATRG